MTVVLPAKNEIRVCFAHNAYDLKTAFDRVAPSINSFQVKDEAALKAHLDQIDVLVVSGLWKNSYLDEMPKLKYVQSVSAGINQYDVSAFKAHNVMLASGQGVNMNAVSEHAIALMLALTRHIHIARDNQHKHVWKAASSDLATREAEVPGKNMVIVGLGRIGNRIAKLAKALDMHVIGVRRHAASGQGEADEVYAFHELKSVIARADVVVLSCPLTDETRHIIDAEALQAMPAHSYLINVARGGCVDEQALIHALETKVIAGAGIDVTETEPLADNSPLWDMDNVMLTPHSAGETQQYEINVVNILMQNLTALWDGDTTLVNQIA